MQIKQWLYFGISFIGVALIKGFDERISLTFMLIGICSAMLSGMAYTCIRKLKDTEHPVVVVLYFPLVAIPIMSVLSYLNWVTPKSTDWLYLVLMGLFTQIAQILMTRGIQSGIANKMISLKYVGTIYALGIGYILFGESYGILSLLGIAIIRLGTSFISCINRSSSGYESILTSAFPVSKNTFLRAILLPMSIFFNSMSLLIIL